MVVVLCASYSSSYQVCKYLLRYMYRTAWWASGSSSGRVCVVFALSTPWKHSNLMLHVCHGMGLGTRVDGLQSYCTRTRKRTRIRTRYPGKALPATNLLEIYL